MKRLATLLGIVLMLSVVGVAPAAAHGATPDVIPWERGMNSETYWENRLDVDNCVRWNADEQQPILPALATQYTIVKGGQWVNVYSRYADPPHVHGFLRGEPKNFGISWYARCFGEDPRGPEAAFFGKAYGPKGDPWYRFTFWNRGETSGTCFVKVNGDIIFKKRIESGYGFKTGWRFVPGYAKVNMSCWSGGEKVWGKRFTAAAPGYYAPLWKGYTRGYFQI